MGLGVRAAAFTYVAHALAVAAAAMVLFWCVHFRGGLALEATNKNLIFNVSTTTVPLLLCFVRAPGSEGRWLDAANFGFRRSVLCSLKWKRTGEIASSGKWGQVA
jgi:hypothetical protein